MKKSKIFTLGLITLMSSCLFLSGCGKKEVKDIKQTKNINELKKQYLYVLHNDTYTRVSNRDNTFGSYINNNPDISNIIWINTDEEDKDPIPTVYKGDKLILCTTDELPESISFCRFADMGYSFGMYGLEENKAGKFLLPLNSDSISSNTTIPIKEKSSANQILNTDTKNKNIIVYKIGEDILTNNNVSYAGTILGLEKNKSYKTQIYAGTFKTDYTIKADNHLFVNTENYISYNYEFIDKNIAELTFPELALTGYYYVGGYGFVRYVTDDKYDENTDFNKKQLDYNEEGPNTIYNSLINEEEETTDTLNE